MVQRDLHYKTDSRTDSMLFAPESVEKHDITKSASKEVIHLSENDLLIVGMPVYAGRIPAIAIDALNKFKGNKTPAVIVCVYGNRDYDDALLELKDIVQNNGFSSFPPRHSLLNIPFSQQLELLVPTNKTRLLLKHSEKKVPNCSHHWTKCIICRIFK